MTFNIYTCELRSFTCDRLTFASRFDRFAHVNSLLYMYKNKYNVSCEQDHFESVIRFFWMMFTWWLKKCFACFNCVSSPTHLIPVIGSLSGLSLAWWWADHFNSILINNCCVSIQGLHPLKDPAFVVFEGESFGETLLTTSAVVKLDSLAFGAFPGRVTRCFTFTSRLLPPRPAKVMIYATRCRHFLSFFLLFWAHKESWDMWGREGS